MTLDKGSKLAVLGSTAVALLTTPSGTKPYAFGGSVEAAPHSTQGLSAIRRNQGGQNFFLGPSAFSGSRRFGKKGVLFQTAPSHADATRRELLMMCGESTEPRLVPHQVATLTPSCCTFRRDIPIIALMRATPFQLDIRSPGPQSALEER